MSNNELLKRVNILTKNGTWWNTSWWEKDKYYEGGLVTREQAQIAYTELKSVFNAKWTFKQKGAGINSHPLFNWLLAEGLMPFHYLVSLGLRVHRVKNANLLGDLEKRLKDSNEFWGADFELQFLAHFLQHGFEIQRNHPSGRGNRNCDFKISKSGETVFVEIKRPEDVCYSNKVISNEAWNNFRKLIIGGESENWGDIVKPLSSEAEINKILDIIGEAEYQLPNDGAGIIILASPLALNLKQFKERVIQHISHLAHLSSIVVVKTSFDHQLGVHHRIYIIQNPQANIDVSSFEAIKALYALDRKQEAGY